MIFGLITVLVFYYVNIIFDLPAQLLSWSFPPALLLILYCCFTLSSRGSSSGCGNSQTRGVCAQPLWKRGRLHHGGNRKGLQEGEGNEERWDRDVFKCVCCVFEVGPINKSQDKSCKLLIVFVCESTGVYKCSNMVAEDDSVFILWSKCHSLHPCLVFFFFFC